MKKPFLFLLAASSALMLTGCIVYQPGSGEYGYTYDYVVPHGIGGTPVPTVAVGQPVAAYENIPGPPQVPPVYSQIPDPTPRDQAASAITGRRVLLPAAPAPVIHETAGAQVQAQPAAAAAAPQAYPAAGVAPMAGDYVSGNFYFPPGTNGTNVATDGSSVTNQTNSNLFGSLTNTSAPEVTEHNVNTARTNVLDNSLVNEAAGTLRGEPGQFRPNYATNYAGQRVPQVTATNGSFSVPAPATAPNQSPQSETPSTTGQKIAPVQRPSYNPVTPIPQTQPAPQQPSGPPAPTPSQGTGSGIP